MTFSWENKKLSFLNFCKFFLFNQFLLFHEILIFFPDFLIFCTIQFSYKNRHWSWNKIQHGKWKDATQNYFSTFSYTHAAINTHTHRANTLICTTKLSKSNYRIARITRHVNYRARHVNINALNTRCTNTNLHRNFLSSCACFHFVQTTLLERPFFWFVVVSSVTIQRPTSVNTLCIPPI